MRHRLGVGVGHHLKSDRCNADPGQGEGRDRGKGFEKDQMAFPTSPLLALRFQKALFIWKEKKKEKKKIKEKQKEN